MYVSYIKNVWPSLSNGVKYKNGYNCPQSPLHCVDPDPLFEERFRNPRKRENNLCALSQMQRRVLPPVDQITHSLAIRLYQVCVRSVVQLT